MGAGGHMMDMYKTLKRNRELRRSKKEGFKDGYDGSTLSKGKLKFKNLPPEELSILLDQIRNNQRS